MNEAAPWGLMPEIVGRWIGDDMARRAAVKTQIVRVLIVLNIVFACQYIVWRALFSVNWAAWPFGLALLAAEFFSFVDCLLFGMTMWNIRQRGEPPAPPQEVTVDVFITTYNEPVQLVRETAMAAAAIRYPHRTWVLDDGNRAEMRAMTEAIGVGYLSRSSVWQGKDRHAKAGNLVNAIYQTTGEFLLILDADQVPRPQILDRVLGYFNDPKVAFVQTPQWFKNTPPGDPFGTDAPLFYGPIQAGKDGWNSGFFCGSNAVLRREALMLTGVVWYVRELEARVREGLETSNRLLRQCRRNLREDADPRLRHAIDDVLGVVIDAKTALRDQKPVQEVTWEFQRKVERISRRIVMDDLETIRAELADLPGFDNQLILGEPETALVGLSSRDMSPLGALAAVRALLTGIDMDHFSEAEPVLPMSTISLTEDMATAMRLHALGWTSVYHHEVLAVGLAPDDLHSALTQRLRWAQGTLQVLLRENPLWQPGLTIPQRLLYFGTMWSYLSGFAAVVYIGAPMMFLVFGLMPVKAYSWAFFAHLLPWLLCNQLLFTVIGWGLATRRGQQYSLALFPLWIKACYTTVLNVYFGRKLGFIVTPKIRQGGISLGLVWVQLVAMGLLLGAIVIGFARLALGWTPDAVPVLINVFWAAYSLVMLSVVIEAATYRPAVE
jgi:cellulose synthase (UDP-forming)